MSSLDCQCTALQSSHAVSPRAVLPFASAETPPLPLRLPLFYACLIDYIQPRSPTSATTLLQHVFIPSSFTQPPSPSNSDASPSLSTRLSLARHGHHSSSRHSTTIFLSVTFQQTYYTTTTHLFLFPTTTLPLSLSLQGPSLYSATSGSFGSLVRRIGRFCIRLDGEISRFASGQPGIGWLQRSIRWLPLRFEGKHLYSRIPRGTLARPSSLSLLLLSLTRRAQAPTKLNFTLASQRAAPPSPPPHAFQHSPSPSPPASPSRADIPTLGGGGGAGNMTMDSEHSFAAPRAVGSARGGTAGRGGGVRGRGRGRGGVGGAGGMTRKKKEELTVRCASVPFPLSRAPS